MPYWIWIALSEVLSYILAVINSYFNRRAGNNITEAHRKIR